VVWDTPDPPFCAPLFLWAVSGITTVSVFFFAFLLNRLKIFLTLISSPSSLGFSSWIPRWVPTNWSWDSFPSHLTNYAITLCVSVIVRLVMWLTVVSGSGFSFSQGGWVVSWGAAVSSTRSVYFLGWRMWSHLVFFCIFLSESFLRGAFWFRTNLSEGCGAFSPRCKPPVSSGNVVLWGRRTFAGWPGPEVVYGKGLVPSFRYLISCLLTLRHF